MEQSEPFVRSLLNPGRNETIDEPGHSSPGGPLTMTQDPRIAKQDLGEDQRIKRTQHPRQLDKRASATFTRVALGWKRLLQAVNRVWGRGWTAETCSYIFSILALAGLISTLSAHQNKPLPQWPQLVTINSIISLFSLLMRACVGVVLAEGISQCKWNWYRKAKKLNHIERLDSASRGSWGAATFLYHFRPRQAYYIAALGAITTIMASLTGFFSQQLVQFQDCLQKDTAALVNISRTNSYAQTGGSAQNNAPVDYAPMVAAVNVGVLQRTGDLTNVLSSGCSSGNCTFSDFDEASFSTLAIGHLCEDITTRIYIINETTHNDSIPSTTAYLGLDYGNNQTFEWSREQGGPVVRSWIGAPLSKADITLINFLFRPHWDNTDWKVASCSLYPSINTYAASIVDAILQEYPIDSIPLRPILAQFEEPLVLDQNFTNLSFMWAYKMTTNYTIQNGIRESCEGSNSPASDLVRFLKSSDEPTYVNSTGHTNPSAGWKWWYYPKNCIWSLHKFPTMAIAETLSEVFDFQDAIMGRKGGVMGSAHLRVLFEDGNITFNSIDKRIRDLATSMTTIVRTTGGDGTLTYTPEFAEGVVWVNTTCVYIRWRWISFPAVMIGLTGGFLILVTIENRGVENDRLWKSSFLAALFCEVETHDKPIGKEEMRTVAKSTSVSLEGKSGRLILVAG